VAPRTELDAEAQRHAAMVAMVDVSGSAMVAKAPREVSVCTKAKIKRRAAIAQGARSTFEIACSTHLLCG
jgi:hypothetical protein